jgi:hypothetical protein
VPQRLHFFNIKTSKSGPKEAKPKSHKPQAKSQVGMQMGNFSSKMQQVARKAAPD